MSETATQTPPKPVQHAGALARYRGQNGATPLRPATKRKPDKIVRLGPTLAERVLDAMAGFTEAGPAEIRKAMREPVTIKQLSNQLYRLRKAGKIEKIGKRYRPARPGQPPRTAPVAQGSPSPSSPPSGDAQGNGADSRERPAPTTAPREASPAGLHSSSCSNGADGGERPAPLTAADILDQAASTIRQRGVERDQADGERRMGRAVAAFNAVSGRMARDPREPVPAGDLSLTERDGWIFMVILKIARSYGGRHQPDDYLDGAAYMGLAGETAARKAT